MTDPDQNAPAAKPASQPAPNPGFRSGFVALLGLPNAGKSTLMNALVGEHLAAVSGLPQTTRDRIHGILTDDAMQAIFVDLPGLVQPDDKLNEALRARVLESLDDADVILHLVDPSMQPPITEEIAGLLDRVTTPVLMVVTKLDHEGDGFDPRRWASGQVHFAARRYQAILAVSSLLRSGLPQLVEEVRALLPEGPAYYDPEDLTDRDMRFLASEMIREKVFHYLHQELPYAIAVEIEEFKERERGKWHVAAAIHVERDSQKGMVIGKGGSTLKKIGQAARQSIEGLVGAGVFLDLHVRVTKDWRRDAARLREFGYLRPARQKHK